MVDLEKKKIWKKEKRIVRVNCKLDKNSNNSNTKSLSLLSVPFALRYFIIRQCKIQKSLMSMNIL